MIWDEGPRTALNSGQRLLASLLRFLDRDAETSFADGLRRFRNKHSLSFHGVRPEAYPNMYLFGVSVQANCAGSHLFKPLTSALLHLFSMNLDVKRRNE